MLEKMKKDNKGFTLVELIVVIAILGILVAVLAPQYIKYVDKSRWATDQNQCSTLLNEVQVAIVDTQEQGKTVSPTDAKIVIAKGTDGNTTITPADNTGIDMLATLSDIDPNWRTLKITNTGSAAGTAKHATYTITYNAKGAKGEWTA